MIKHVLTFVSGVQESVLVDFISQEDKCQEIEQHKYNNTKRIFNIIREITRKGPMPASKCIRSEDGTILWEDVEIKLR